jgi:hypothetical protein
MEGLVGVFVIVTFVIAIVIASAGDRDRTGSFGRFIGRFIVAWILVIGAGFLLLLGICAVMIGSMH